MGCFRWPIIAGLMVIHWKVSFQICTSGGLSSWWWNSDRISSTSYTKCLRVCGLLPIQSMCVLWIWSKCPHLSLPPGKMGSWASYWESSSLCLPEYRAWFVLSGISQTWSLLVLDYSRNVLWQALVTTICMDRIYSTRSQKKSHLGTTGFHPSSLRCCTRFTPPGPWLCIGAVWVGGHSVTYSPDRWKAHVPSGGFFCT